MYVLMDGVQIPVVAAETEGRTGRIEGQRARTRECKLGAVFTQTSVDKDGRPIRDPDSTSYVGAVETADEFGYRIYTEAWRRGWEWATTKIVIGDGAVWIWNLADQHFPGAIQIVDLYHARQHLWDLAALLYPHDAAAKKRWMVPMRDLLDHGRTELLVEWLARTRRRTRRSLNPAWRRRSANRQITSKPTCIGCGTRSFANKASSSVPA